MILQCKDLQDRSKADAKQSVFNIIVPKTTGFWDLRIYDGQEVMSYLNLKIQQSELFHCVTVPMVCQLSSDTSDQNLNNPRSTGPVYGDSCHPSCCVSTLLRIVPILIMGLYIGFSCTFGLEES